jgi:uncharacterized protein
VKKGSRLLINLSCIGEHGRCIKGSLSPEIVDVSRSDHLRLPYPVDYDLNISIVQASALIIGRVYSTICCQCDRCLSDFEKFLENPNICHYIPVTEDKTIDLTDEIREDMLIVFPQKVLCSKDCRGLCRFCGQNLNKKKCSCPNENSDTNAWNQLDELCL